jgi:hypothetical protein
MRPSIGGGNFPMVQLDSDKAGAEIMGTIVPMASEVETQPLKMVDESALYYIVLVPSDVISNAYLVDKTLVKGIVPAQL